ncbi:ABC transporter (iron.B12.siderophore.hemin), permease component [Tritonibacter mobilis]|uniref:iron chelate uptake ABC transporter family permease subunit n=1 Tax=Tritonibacter mobilis TaxID=379347 RepID=UPI000F6F99EA|nr:ABC transporter (iron.B12.siderophore.hemin), permease component [Tritonibacter mobilis]
MVTFVVSALITEIMVAFSGTIGFVGRTIPHIARILVGGDYRSVLPLSALIARISSSWDVPAASPSRLG